ncbi:hypothetical protein [Sporosarcina sp. SAFN-010]|uniref:hypothetical protein n=1 Tax=Sporosarcina sp. SAFN-010 TaxID=3387273 RepID=UPI003F81A1BA
MSSMKGTVRLVYEGALFFLGKFLFLYLTIPLTVGWILIGLLFGVPDNTVVAISGPTYFFIPMFAVTGFRSLLPIAIAFGGTRIQLLKVFYVTGIAAVSISILFLNILQYILITVYNQWSSSVNILHPGVYVLGDYHFPSYLWIDLMVGLLLFGIAFLLYCILYRLGIKRTIIITTVLSLIGMFLYYGNILDINSFEWIWNHDLNPLKLFTLAGLLGLGSLFITYPMMRHAPLNKSMVNVG